MDDLERRMKLARPEAVPEELDESVRRLIRVARLGQPERAGIWVPLRATLAAAAAAVVLGILIGLALATRNTAETPAEIVVTAPMPPRIAAVLEGRERTARRQPVLSRTWTSVSFHPVVECPRGPAIRKEVTR